MVCKIARSEVFIPTAGGNDKEDKPVKFYINYLTVADRSELDNFIVPLKVSAKNMRVKFDMREAFVRSVTRIENLTVEEDGEMKLVASSTDFADLPFNQNPVLRDMYDEVCMRIKETSEIQKKSL
jgi:hypothetical protein